MKTSLIRVVGRPSYEVVQFSGSHKDDKDMQGFLCVVASPRLLTDLRARNRSNRC
jgi:hypothetical protein